ncbi:MAG TPA: AzlD domain-containing protein, partial [Chloroflexota bacterium]
MRIDTIITIAGMALVTYGMRGGGMWLMRFATPSPRMEAWLRHIPGSVLAAIIAPAVVAHGVAGVIAVVVTATVAWRSGNLLLAMA